MTPNAPPLTPSRGLHIGWIAIACIHLNHLELELLPAKIVLATGMGYTMLNARPRCHFHCVFPRVITHRLSQPANTIRQREPFWETAAVVTMGLPTVQALLCTCSLTSDCVRVRDCSSGRELIPLARPRAATKSSVKGRKSSPSAPGGLPLEKRQANRRSILRHDAFRAH
jgi:hypothetical protein